LEVARDEVGSALDELLRDGAQRMLMQAVLAEVDDYVAAHQHERGPDGCRLVVRNGLGKARTLVTPVGAMRVRAPRVRDDRRDEEGQPLRFVSQILPPYLRRTKSVSELIPWLYLKGISTGDFSEALGKLLGPDAPGLSSTTVVRLKQVWLGEYDTWRKRDLSHERYVYMWVDGIHCNVRLDDERQCFLVIIGATQDGRKQLLAVEDGFRESEASWKAVLEDLKARGLATPPKLAVGDGALGFWAALPQVYGPTREQRCWVHKTANVLDKMPKSAQGKGRQMIHDIYLAETRKQAEAAFDKFIATYGAKLPKAVECLKKDRDQLLAFYDFPAEHWAHLRTTNPVESTFATVRLRHRRTKGSGSREASLTMVFMLARQAESHWRRLNGSNALVQVIQGKKFQDGVLVQENAA
jgi:transposase-like protein